MAHDLKALTREWYEAVWNRRDTASIARLAWPEARCHGMGGDADTAGMEAFSQVYRTFLSAFPDLHVVVEDVLLEGDKTVARLKFGGRHSGEGIGVPPTNNRFAATAIVITRWRDGKIAEAWNEYDAAGMMQQLAAPGAKLRA